MGLYSLILLACCVLYASAWSLPYYPRPIQRGPIRITRFAPQPYRLPRIPIQVAEPDEEQWQERPKRNHRDDYNFDDAEHDHHDHHNHEHKGITGPVHTFVKTDKNANYKWGVRHHVGNKYAS